MATDHRAHVEELLADYRRSRDRLASVHRALVSVREAASSPDGLLTAHVGPQGQLIELVIAEDVYRHYRPGQLSSAVVRLTALAAGNAARRAHETLAPALPPDADPAAVISGRADLRGDEIGLAQPPAEVPRRQPSATSPDDEEDLAQRSWLGPATGEEREVGAI